MMRKKIVSLCMALTLCLSLLPATALAAETNTVYVGGVALTGSSENIVYATTNESGEVITEGATADNYNIKWDGSTLTLHDATIQKELNDSNLFISGSAIGVINQNGNAELTIQLEGSNTIEETNQGLSMGIYVYSSGSGAALNIKGNGTLVLNSNYQTIQVISSNGNAALSIENAKVTATSSYGFGVTVRSGSSETSSASLTVDGGSLTATAQSSGVSGIRLMFGTGGTSDGTPTVTVSNNAIVRAKGSAGGITSNSSTGVQYGTGSNSTGGIVWNGKNGTVYGDVTLQEALTIGEGESLDIPSGASLNTDGKLTVDGGTLTGNVTGTVNYKVTGVLLSSDTLTLNVGETAQLTATVLPETATNRNVTWSSNAPGVATVNSSGKVTAVSAGTATITVTTADGGKTATCEVTVTAATVPVTGVTLSQNQASLYYNRTPNTLTLTATVAPDNATNQAVTWASSNPSVAKVENGVVTALACGTAVITAAAADGSGASASCTVTVSSYLPPANPNYRITVEATQGGTVTADPTAAKAGTTVTLTPVPDRGYQVGTVAVTDRFGDPVAVTENADGTYTFTMPNGQVTVTVTFEQAPLPFPDVTEGDWFYDAVRYAYETGLMDGVGDSLFAPNSQTTRAQLVTILYRLAGEPEPGGDSGFADVETGTWYTDAVAWAAENGIVNGVSDTEFAPGDDITREQLAAILYRYAACQGYDVSQRADLSGFGDASSISDYAQEALSWAHAQGLVLGFEDGSLRPQGTASRAQIAAVLMRFLAAVSAE